MFNLRGNQRTSGELSRKEGGKIFGSGSRTPISITLLIKKPDKQAAERARIFYHDIGDYLNREEKLKLVRDFGSILNPDMKLSSITPNEAYDWINQRDNLFESFIPISQSKKYLLNAHTFFVTDSNGIQTNRDSWAYNFSRHDLTKNMSNAIDFYNQELSEYRSRKEKCENFSLEKSINSDPSKFSWTRNAKKNLTNGIPFSFSISNIRTAVYRPFCKKNLYFSRQCNEYINQWPKFFPTPQSKNLVICCAGIGSNKGFMPLMVNTIPDVQLQFNGQCFPLYYYEKVDKGQLGLFDSTEDEYIRRDAISDFILERARQEYGPKTTKEDIFYYVYALLHSKCYRERFCSDLKKMLPRIPIINSINHFKAFSRIGRSLSNLHVEYEKASSYNDVIITGEELGDYTISQMRFGKEGKEEDRRKIIYNHKITIENIPLRAYDYVINGKSAIEWIMERYSLTVHKESRIENDPNTWCEEHKNPRYIIELLLSIITLSMETMKLVSELPELSFEESFE